MKRAFHWSLFWSSGWNSLAKRIRIHRLCRRCSYPALSVVSMLPASDAKKRYIYWAFVRWYLWFSRTGWCGSPKLAGKSLYIKLCICQVFVYDSAAVLISLLSSGLLSGCCCPIRHLFCIWLADVFFLWWCCCNGLSECWRWRLGDVIVGSCQQSFHHMLFCIFCRE